MNNKGLTPTPTSAKLQFKKKFIKQFRLTALFFEKKQFNIKVSAGLTLIEVIITLALLGIIMAAIASIFVLGIRVYNEQNEKAALQTQSKTLINRIKDDLLQGYRIEPGWVDPDTLDEHLSSENKIIIAVPSIDESNDWIYEDNLPLLDYFIYWQEEDMIFGLIFAENSTHPSRTSKKSRVIAHNANILKFTYDQDASSGLSKQVDIELTLNKQIRNKTIKSNGKLSVKLRNK